MIQNLTMFVSAFHFAEIDEKEESFASIWKPAEIKMDKGIMHDYIQSAFYSATKNEIGGRRKACSDLDFHAFSLDFKNKSGIIAALTKITNSKHLILRSKEKEILFNLKFDQGTLFEPHLFIWPYAHVGLFTFTTELKDGATINDVIDFNYTFRKTDSQSPLFFLSKEIDLKEKGAKAGEGLKNLIDGFKALAIDEEGLEYQTSTRFSKLLEALLPSDVKRFDENRLYPMAYALLSSDEQSEDQLLKDVKILARGENTKYDIKVEKENILQTFNNIYFSTYVEGSAIIITHPLTKEEYDEREGKKHEKDFFENFKTDNLDKRYLWVFVLSMLLRHSQLYWIDQLCLYHDLDEESLRKRLLIPVQRIKASSYFSNISNYTQINQYYSFLNRNLYIEKAFSEIEQKMLPLYEVIAADEQAAKEQQEHDEEVRRMKREEDEKNEEKARDRRILIFTFAFSILTVASFLNDFYSFAKNDLSFILYDNFNIPHIPHILIILPAYIITIAAIYYFWPSRKKGNKTL